jgi:membrane fusion protein (multidrug efflux system)
VSPADQDIREREPREQDDAEENGDDAPREKPRSKLPFIIGGIVILIAIIAGIIYWLATAGEVTTDDAYTDGSAISIAANVSGYVTALNINDNSYVHAGDVLLSIDPREDTAALQQAQANLALAQSQLVSAQVDLEVAQAQAQETNTLRQYRMQTSADRRATSATDVDQAAAQLRSAQASVKSAQAQVAIASLVPQMIESARQEVAQRQAQLAQARASLAQAQVKLTYNEIRAPQDGWITMRNVDLGTYVQAGQQIFYIVSPAFWVTANFKETQLAHMHPGDHVRMTVDAYPGVVLYGHVGSIQAGSGARFSAFPAENATGNFVKIVRRVPVKIIIDNTKPAGLYGLPLGISVDPTVTVK